MNDILLTDFYDLKPGVRSPKTEDQSKLANLYFQSTFSSLTFRPDSIGAIIAFMNTTIYNYFRDTYGLIEDPVSTELKDKYRDSSDLSLSSNPLTGRRLLNLPTKQRTVLR